MALNNLQQRILTAVIGASLMLGAMLWNEYSFGALFLFIALMSQWEFYSLSDQSGIKPQKIMGLLTGAALFIGTFLAFTIPHGDESLFAGMATLDWLFRTWLLSVLLVFFIFIMELYRKKAQPFSNLAFTILGIAYLPFTISLVNYIARAGDDNVFHASIILCLFFILWASDIGAYFVGKRFGKRKLFERISPGKTWEGSVGGTVLALIVAHFVALYNTHLSRADWLVITVIIVVFGTFGDLVESMFKRSINIKDSGTILPGHGGFIDRFDGLFIALPFIFLYLVSRSLF